uniref:CSON010362 protein n=1 Tax=Culicoides sonorensis TaxID=179676 RepID=A0A336M492_CULSO
MKFAEHLSAHITPEWRKQYINYEEMKSMLYLAVEQSPSGDVIDPELAESTRKFANLRSELAEAQVEAMPEKEKARFRKPLIARRKDHPVRKAQELKLAFSEFYLSLVLLQNYQNLNFTGFRKILKKHDKLLSVDFGARWRQEHVEQSHFYTNKDIDRLIAETEQIVTEIEGGNRTKAMKRLRVPPLGEHQNAWITFKVGLFSGAFFILIVAVILSALFYSHKTENFKVAVRLYRAPFLLILFLFFWAINVYGWRSSGVNHVLIFEIDPRNHLSEQHIMELAAIFGVIWSLSVLSYLYSDVLGVPAYVNPLIMYIILLAFLFNPTKTMRHEARFWTLRVVSRVVTAPFWFVNFSDFWVADQLNSIVPAFLDIEFFFCFYTTNSNMRHIDADSVCLNDKSVLRTIVALLPAWFRCAQCLRRYKDTREAFPHLANATKYATSFFVVIFSSIAYITADNYSKSTDNPWFYLWIIASIASSFYAYTWDIKMDWGLFDPKAGDNTFLQVFRRFVWNFFRLENEHLNNCGKFRAVRDISVAPMDSSDQEKIIRMMDCDDGVVNRRKTIGGKQKSVEHRVRINVEDSTEDFEL